MASFTTNTDFLAVQPSAGIRLLPEIAKAFRVLTESNARLRQIERMRALSDADLATLGIARERISHHVFKDIYSF